MIQKKLSLMLLIILIIIDVGLNVYSFYNVSLNNPIKIIDIVLIIVLFTFIINIKFNIFRSLLGLKTATKNQSNYSKNTINDYIFLIRDCIYLLQKAIELIIKIYPVDKNNMMINIVSLTEKDFEINYAKNIIKIYKDYINSIDIKKTSNILQSMLSITSCYTIYDNIPHIINLLENIIDNTEKTTFNIIDKFEKVANENTNAKKEAEKNLEKIKTEIDGKNFNAILQESKQAINKYQEQINLSLELFNNLIKLNKEDEKKLYTINEWIDNINEKLSKINEISERNRIIAINTSIEASHLGEKGKGFHVLAYEIRKLNESTNVFIKDINTIMNSFKKYNKNFIEDWTNRTDNMISKIEKTESKSEEIITKLINSYMLSTDSFIKLIESTGIIDNNLTKLLESLQFQDITRQQIEKVIVFLNDLNKKVNEQQSFFKNSGIADFKENITVNENIKDESNISKVVVF